MVRSIKEKHRPHIISGTAEWSPWCCTEDNCSLNGTAVVKWRCPIRCRCFSAKGYRTLSWADVLVSCGVGADHSTNETIVSSELLSLLQTFELSAPPRVVAGCSLVAACRMPMQVIDSMTLPNYRDNLAEATCTTLPACKQ